MANWEHDYVELERIKNRCMDLLPVTSALSVVTLAAYLGSRLKTVVEALQTNNDTQAVLCSALYLAVEVGLFLPNFLNHLLRCLARSGQGSRGTPHLRLTKMEDPPRVDVFITCCGEDIDTIICTTEAACATEYPSHCFRVLVLDDAGSEELSRRIDTIKKERSNLFYTARKKGPDHHFKAGNLNHGYRYVEKLEGGAAPFIAALDADMIPDPQWLRALVPHLLRNEEVALVQPPQRFYDVPTPDLLLQGLEINYRVTEPLREIMGSTWCGGSGYLIRRDALCSIGEFPTGSIGEDMYCSNVLLGKGWKTRYVDESLQYGRVPDSYRAHTKQQSRWHVGRIQTAIPMGFYLFGERARKMTVRQRAAGLIAACLSLANLTTTVALMLLPIVMLLGRPLIVTPNQQSLRMLLSMAIASIISEWLDDLIVSLITGYKIAMSEGHASYWMAPYHAAALVDAFVPRWLRPTVFEFSATGSRSASNERNGEGRTPLFERVVDILWNGRAVLHVSYILILSIGVVQNLMGIIHYDGESIESWSQAALVFLGWPPLLWLVCLNSMAVPLLYVFFPPTIPNRAELLKRDPERRASYPRDQENAMGQPFYLREDICYSICMVYTLVLMGLMWYLPCSIETAWSCSARFGS